MDFLSGVIKDRGWERAAIGVEMDNYWFSAAAFASLVDASAAAPASRTRPRW